MSVIPYTGMGVWIKPIELVKDPRVSSKEGTISLGVVSAAVLAVAVAVATFLSCLPFPPFCGCFTRRLVIRIGTLEIHCWFLAGVVVSPSRD